MERYSINRTRRKLHTQSCRHAVAANTTDENTNLQKLLSSFDSPLTYCKICLKYDLKAQELVKQHNDRFIWHSKNTKI